MSVRGIAGNKDFEQRVPALADRAKNHIQDHERGLAQHLAGGVTALATRWNITRHDGVAQGFTSHVLDVR
jgi:hypothetical protein